jgi:D-glycero-D-manno-heptose 1,7-bisphosphate phosphatase
MSQKALFLDRDGIINIDKRYLYKIEDFVFVDGIFDICRYYQDRGYMIFVITNQSGIARGYYSEGDLDILHSWMVDRFRDMSITITDISYCPHHSKYGIGDYRLNCECRKPKPGMILELAKRYDIDLPNSLLIGDKPTDIEAGKEAGIKENILINIESDSQYSSLYSYLNYLR